jgi:hypothetical protein
VTAVATAAAEAARRRARDPLNRVRFFIDARLLSVEPRGRLGDSVFAIVSAADEPSHRGDPPVFCRP